MDMIEILAATPSNDTQTQLTVVQILVPIVLGLLAGVGGAWATLARYREKVDQLEKIDCQKRLSSIEGRFEALQSQVTTLQQNSPTNYVQSHSPAKLTPNGEQLLANSGMQEYVDNHFDNLFAQLQADLEPKGEDYSAYDVQERSISAIKAVADDRDFVPIKDYAFAQGLDLTNIQLVGGIYLRNKALEALGFDMDSYYNSDDDGHEHKRKTTNE